MCMFGGCIKKTDDSNQKNVISTWSNLHLHIKGDNRKNTATSHYSNTPTVLASLQDTFLV